MLLVILKTNLSHGFQTLTGPPACPKAELCVAGKVEDVEPVTSDSALGCIAPSLPLATLPPLGGGSGGHWFPY